MRIKINFASREFVLARKINAVLILLLFCLGAVFSYNIKEYGKALDRENMLVSEVRLHEKKDVESSVRLQEIKKTAPEKEVKASLQEAEFANTAIGRRVFSWTAFLNRFEELVPPGVSIQGIHPDFNTLDIEITGTALDMARVTEFMGRLTRSPYFDDLPPVFQSSEVLADKDIGKTLQHFNLKIRYKPGGRKARPEERGRS